MEPFNTPLKIREISLPHRAVFGPMAGFTDAPARRLMAQHGACLLYTSPSPRDRG